METKKYKIRSFSGFKSDEWLPWKLKFQAVLHGEKLYEALTADEPTGSGGAVAEALTKWNENNMAISFY